MKVRSRHGFDGQEWNRSS